MSETAKLLTVREVAATLGIGVSTVWRAVAKGSLPKPIKVAGSTRWRSADIAAVMAPAD